jgi:hypothetical protein
MNTPSDITGECFSQSDIFKKKDKCPGSRRYTSKFEIIPKKKKIKE